MTVPVHVRPAEPADAPAHALYRAAGWVADGATRVADDTGVDVPSSRFQHPIGTHA